MDEPMLMTQSEYGVVVLKVLASLPGGAAPKSQVLQEFWRRYQHRISPEHLKPVPSKPNLPRWENMAAYERISLKNAGLLDMPDKGIWRITDAGRQWLEEHPDATRITAKHTTQPGILSQRSPRQSKRSRQAPRVAGAVPAGITLRKLENVRKLMPSDEFQRDWGELYEYLLAEERAKSVTPVDRKLLLAKIMGYVERIQDFLQGRGSNRPSSEELCDWIYQCYLFGLDREAPALWQLVNKDEVEPWQFERTKKIVAVCRAKVTH